MGHSRKGKAENHERVVRTAAARFRKSGIDGVGVADLMKEAGLTHGGFYRHFASRDALVAEAVDLALRDGGKFVEALHDALDRAEAKSTANPEYRWKLLNAVVDDYLSPKHRDELDTSCAVSALAGDVARSNGQARAAYTRQVGTYLDVLARLIAGGKDTTPRTDAIAALATLVGAISIARAVNDPQLSAEILNSAAQGLKSALQRSKRKTRKEVR